MKKTIKVGYIGLGSRGFGMIDACFSKMNDVEVAYVCDLYDERLEKTVKLFEERNIPAPKTTKDYREILKDETVDAVINMAGWNVHVEITIASLLAGK